MKLRMKGGELVDDDGRVLATVGPMEFAVKPSEEGKRGGTIGGGVGEEVAVPESAASLQTELLEGGSGGKPSADRERVSAEIDAIWAFYVETMQPRKKEATTEDRSLIRKALQVATLQEICGAIKGCAESDYHMKAGQHGNRKGGKYNKLSQIIKGRRGRETTRERIDFFLDRAGEKTFPSVSQAIVTQKQTDVQRGHGSVVAATVERAKESEAWLLAHGIETVQRESDGYPVFRPIGDAA